MKSRVHRSLLLIVAVVAVVAFFGMQTAITAEKSARPVAPAVPSEPRAVHSLGRLEPKGKILQLSAASGNEGSCLSELLVAEGDRVTKGTVLARLDTFERRQAALNEADAQVKVAEAQLAQILSGNRQGDIDAARAAADLAKHEVDAKKRDLDRAERLRERKAISASEMDDAQLAFDRAQLEWKRLQGVLASTEEIRAVDVAAQQAQVDLAKSSRARAQADFRATQIVAPQDGTILKIHAQVGERPADQGILEIGNVAQMQAVAEVFEGDLHRVTLRQRVEVRLEATGDTLVGEVAELGSMVARKKVLTNDPVSDTDARVVEVRVDLDPKTQSLVQRLSNARVQVHFVADNPASSSGPQGEPAPASGPWVSRR